MSANPDVVDTTKPEAVVPDTSTTPVMEPMISVEVQDRLLRELKRRLFPSDVEGILYSAIVGDIYWQDQLWSLMVDTWPRLQTNLGKLKQAVSSMDYAVHPFTEGDEEPTASAQEKADFVEDALFGMHGDVARQEHDFEQTLEDITDSLIAGFTVMEVYWEHRDGGIVPQCTRWLPARYYRYPYVLDDIDRLMLNPSGMLGGTQLVDFPPYKFLVCVKQSHANHPVFTSPMRCLTAWWIASRFGLEWMMSYAQLFGIPQRIAYYQPGDDVVYQKLVQMMRASATATWGVYPVNTKVELLGTAGGGGAHMPQERLVDEADKVCDIMLLGQTLTTEVRESGGNRALGMVHHRVMDEILEAASRYVSKVISTQLIPGIVQYNFGSIDELPTLAPVIKDPVDLFNLAQAYNILFNQMQVPVLNSELYERIEFTKPDKGDDVYVPPATPVATAPSTSPFGVRPEPEGTKPQPEHAPNGNQPAALKPNIVERVGASNIIYDSDGRSIGISGNKGPDDSGLAGAYASNGDPDDNDDPDDGSLVEARHEHRHPKTGRFIPAPKAAPKRKVGKRTGPMPEVGLMCKHSQTMEDNKVCQACKDICEEGWIPIDEEYLGYSMNPPHHPNCLLGDALVLPVGRITAVTKRWFDGEVLIIHTTANHVLTCTPNHPILTDQGVVAAQSLNLGSCVLSNFSSQRPPSIEDQGYDVPTRIEEIVETFLASSEVNAIKVPTASPDFHGDVTDGEIAIVGTDGALSAGDGDEGFEEFCEPIFEQRGPHLFALSSERCFASLTGWDFATPDRGVSGKRALPSRLRANVVHVDGLLLAHGSEGGAMVAEYSSDSASANAVGLSDCFDSKSSFVSLDYVRFIERKNFRGHVFNIETTKHYYFANGIATHNCRCSNEYKTVYRGVNIFHQTVSGNPHHHPKTGRFVSKPR